jgi:predicted polyphosphate/ATP-dependent NAD kinase
MIGVGIVANPASGRDIRRLVAHGSVFDNDEKVNTVRRVLLGLEAVDVEQVWIMPDSFGIGQKALDGLRLGLAVSLLRMPVTFTQEDSTRAAALMAAAGARCIVTIGGDGTNRAVAKAVGEVPLVPISTGTNNVFPTMVEGSIAGLAAGLVARGLADAAVRTVPCLQVNRPAAPVDLALVDAAVYEERFVASRAVWDDSRLREVVLARSEPGSIGLSAIGAHLPGPNHRDGHGLHLRLGAGGQRVLAPIGPGLIRPVSVVECRALAPGEDVVVSPAQPCVLALDGGREVVLRPDEPVCLQLQARGPRVVDVRRAVELAARDGVFLREAVS